MARDTVKVGSNDRDIYVVGDNINSANLASVLALADGLSLAGKYGSIVGAVSLLVNDAGLYTVAHTASGVNGVQATSTESRKTTYSTYSVLEPPAATATDIWTLFGTGGQVARLTRLALYGIATAATSVNLFLLRRSTTNTGWTSTTPTPVSQDTGDTTVAGTVTLYSANPATLGTSLGAIRAGKLNLGVDGSAGSVVWDFGANNDKTGVLRAASEGLCLNWGGVAVPAGTKILINATWTAE